MLFYSSNIEYMDIFSQVDGLWVMVIPSGLFISEIYLSESHP